MSRFLITGAVLLATLGAGLQAAATDVYLILYATHDGRTGHAGIAVDQYRIRVIDCADCPGGVRYDTAATGELTYFDLWPSTDDLSYQFLFSTVPAHYYRLPTGNTELPITVNSLLRLGLPHALEDSCDGLLKLPTSPTRDFELIEFLQAKIDGDEPFSTYTHNCADFVAAGLSFALMRPVEARERVLMRSATTPNCLWRTVAALPDARILRDPGDKVNGGFDGQRIFYHKS